MPMSYVGLALDYEETCEGAKAYCVHHYSLELLYTNLLHPTCGDTAGCCTQDTTRYVTLMQTIRETYVDM